MQGDLDGSRPKLAENGDNMRKGIVLMLALAIIGAAFLALPANVSAQAEVPVWNIGDGWYFGNTADFSEMQAEIDQGLQDLPPGFDADINVAGGVGVYFGVEVVDDDVVVNGYTCYQVDINGAVGIDFGIEADISGSVTEDVMSIDVDASGNGFIVGEANLDGSLYFTVDELAFTKGEFTLTAEAEAAVTIDAFVDMHMDMTGFGGEVQDLTTDINADVSLLVQNVNLQGSVECDPPLDFFNFPIYEYDSWYLPESGTDITTTWSAQGTIDVSADITGIPNEPEVHEHETRDLAVEIGSGTETYLTGYYDQVYLECVAVYGNNYIIETSTGEFFNYIDWGTKQYGIDYLDMLPVDDLVPEKAGIQYSSDSGFVTGVSADGEVQTSTTDKATVDNFIAEPLDYVEGHGSVGEGGAVLGALLLIGIIAIVVIFVVVVIVVSKRKKSGPEDVYGAPQQPPPYQPPPQYPPQQPPPPPQQPPYQPPPPPPPEGQ